MASITSPETRPSGVPIAIAATAKPPKPGTTSARKSRRVGAAWARAAAANAETIPIAASTTPNAGCG